MVRHATGATCHLGSIGHVIVHKPEVPPELQYRLGEVKQSNVRGWDRNWTEEACCLQYLASGAERHVFAGSYTKGRCVETGCFIRAAELRRSGGERLCWLAGSGHRATAANTRGWAPSRQGSTCNAITRCVIKKSANHEIAKRPRCNSLGHVS